MYNHVLFGDIASNIDADAPAISENDKINVPAQIA
jgi:hypothetical protein